MDWNKQLYREDEKPLDRLVEGYSLTSVLQTVAFVGDSLSSGEFETRDKDGNPGYYDMFEYSWGQYIARKNGIKAYSFSRGGMTCSEYMQSFGEAMGYWDREKACRAYVIALGVNDICNMGQEKGSREDIDLSDYRNNKPTFTGWYGALIQRYKEISPDAKFFLVTPPLEGAPAHKHLTDIRDTVYELSQVFDNIYVIDLYEYGPNHDRKFKQNFYLYGHLTAAGYVHTAEIIDSYIDYIIRHNPMDFKNIPFVTTDIQY